MLYNLNHILKDIEYHLNNKKPFSLVRLGDGDIKLLHSACQGIVHNDKFRRQGIPGSDLNIVIQIYRKSCNNANYISSFDVYFDGNFWSRKSSSGTRKKLESWKKIYKKIGIQNQSYCNPEIGFLLFLRSKYNLFNLIKDKKICLITCFKSIELKLRKLNYDVNTILIPKIYSNHYSKYKPNKLLIKSSIEKNDIFLIGAGGLGKGYSKVIKRNGGIAIDIGQVFNSWAGSVIPPRISKYMKLNEKDLTFRFTKIGEKFREWI